MAKKNRMKKKSKQRTNRSDLTLPLVDEYLENTSTTSLLAGKSCVQHLLELSNESFPFILSECLVYALPVVDLIFIGKLGNNHLVSATLAMLWFHLNDVIMTGIIDACGRFELRHSVVIIFLATVIVSGCVAQCGEVMRLLGIDLYQAHEAGLFAVRLIPGLFPYYLFKSLIKYLQTHKKMFSPGMCIGVFVNILNVLFNWLFIFVANWGIAGSPIAINLTRISELFLISLYMSFGKCWPTSHEMNCEFEGVLQVITQIAEKWNTSVATMAFASLLDTETLGAHGVVLIISFFLQSIPAAVGTVSSAKIMGHIEDRNASDAKCSICSSFLLSLSLMVAVNIVMLSCNHKLAKIFSKNADVVQQLTELIPIMTVGMLSSSSFLGGMLRGLKYYWWSLYHFTFSHWILTMPAMIFLMHNKKLGVSGLWWGLNVGMFSSSVLGLCSLIIHFDRQKGAVPAIIRKDELERKESGDGTIISKLTCDYGDFEKSQEESEDIHCMQNDHDQMITPLLEPSPSSNDRSGITSSSLQRLANLTDFDDDDKNGGCYKDELSDGVLSFSSLKGCHDEDEEQQLIKWPSSTQKSTNKLPINLIATQLEFNGPTLTLLMLDGRKEITHKEWNDLFQALRSNHYLEHLSVADCGLSDKNLIPLLSALAFNNTLKSLNLSHNRGIDDDTGKALAEILRTSNTTIVNINLIETSTTRHMREKINEILTIRGGKLEGAHSSSPPHHSIKISNMLHKSSFEKNGNRPKVADIVRKTISRRNTANALISCSNEHCISPKMQHGNSEDIQQEEISISSEPSELTFASF